jgi:hypothetical protein
LYISTLVTHALSHGGTTVPAVFAPSNLCFNIRFYPLLGLLTCVVGQSRGGELAVHGLREEVAFLSLARGGGTIPSANSIDLQ